MSQYLRTVIWIALRSFGDTILSLPLPTTLHDEKLPNLCGKYLDSELIFTEMRRCWKFLPLRVEAVKRGYVWIVSYRLRGSSDLSAARVVWSISCAGHLIYRLRGSPDLSAARVTDLFTAHFYILIKPRLNARVKNFCCNDTVDPEVTLEPPSEKSVISGNAFELMGNRSAARSSH